MCGIVGIVGKEGQNFLNGKKEEGASLAIRKQMFEARKTLLPRGPDSSGVSFRKNVAFGHTLLKTVDGSDSSKQPMTDESLGLTITFNGAIYNYEAIKKELAGKIGSDGNPYSFTTKGDTEVLLKAYDYWVKVENKPDAFLNKLDGMFAFAMHDHADDRVFLARDKVGQKPLYYSAQDERFVFGSSPQSLFPFGGISEALDPIGIEMYKASGVFVPAPHTVLQDVKKLPAGHYMTVKGGSIVKAAQRYWEPFAKSETRSQFLQGCEQWTETQWRKTVRETLKQSIRNCMVGDQEIGIALSGGLDSALILHLMTEIVEEMKKEGTWPEGKKIKTFSYSYLPMDYLKNELKLLGYGKTDLLEELDLAIEIVMLKRAFEKKWGGWGKAQNEREDIKLEIHNLIEDADEYLPYDELDEARKKKLSSEKWKALAHIREKEGRLIFSNKRSEEMSRPEIAKANSKYEETRATSAARLVGDIVTSSGKEPILQDALAKSYDTEHFPVDVTRLAIERDLAQKRGRSIHTIGEPNAVFDGVACTLIAKEAKKEGCTILLGGEVADELFAGYGFYPNVANAENPAEEYIKYMLADDDVAKDNAAYKAIVGLFEQGKSEGREGYKPWLYGQLTWGLADSGFSRIDGWQAEEAVEHRAPFASNDMLELVAHIPDRQLIRCKDGKKDKAPSYSTKHILRRIGVKEVKGWERRANVKTHPINPLVALLPYHTNRSVVDDLTSVFAKHCEAYTEDELKQCVDTLPAEDGEGLHLPKLGLHKARSAQVLLQWLEAAQEKIRSFAKEKPDTAVNATQVEHEKKQPSKEMKIKR